jgi:hypothetical protein
VADNDSGIDLPYTDCEETRFVTLIKCREALTSDTRCMVSAAGGHCRLEMKDQDDSNDSEGVEQEMQKWRRRPGLINVRLVAAPESKASGFRGQR